LDQNEAAIQAKRLDLTFRSEPPLVVPGHLDRLIRLFANLIDNAVRYTPIAGRMLVAIARQKDQARVCIGNSGEGIPEPDLLRVFDRFYRVAKDRSRVSGGAGLGLAIAREIARAHGGEITVESRSEDGGGMPASGAMSRWTTFTVSLPLYGEAGAGEGTTAARGASGIAAAK
jgi:signal transduction histidine kinase